MAKTITLKIELTGGKKVESEIDDIGDGLSQMSRIDARNAKEALDRIDRTTLNQIKSEVSSVNKETTELARNANTSANTYRDASGRMRNANGQFVKSADDAKRAVDSFGKANATAGKSTDNFSSKLKISSEDLLSYGKSAALAGAALAVLYAKNLLESGIKYESALNKFQAATKATDDQMKLAAARAKELGKDLKLPATSAGDAALAMTELAKSNFDFNESMAATRGVLLLAAAATTDEATAAKIAANAINAFNLEASESTRIADLLAGASNAASGEITDIAEAMQQSSASFAAAKVPIEDLITAIGIMANAGIQGSDAGTSLKTFLSSLQAPTDGAAKALQELGIKVFDLQGRLIPLPEIIGLFEKSLAGLTDEKKAQAIQKIFGSDASRAAQILFQSGVEGFDKMKEAVTETGAAADLAAAKTKGLGGAWEAFKSQLETIDINLFEKGAPSLEGMVKAASEMAAKFGEVLEQELAKQEPNATNSGMKIAEAIAKGLGVVISESIQKELQTIDWSNSFDIPKIGAAFKQGLIGDFNLYDVVKGLFGDTTASSQLADAWAQSLIDGIANGINNDTKRINAVVQNLLNGVIDSLNDGATAARAAADRVAQGLVDGLVNGVNSGAARARAAAFNAISSVMSIFSSVPKVESPSKVTTEIGEFISEGLAIGIENKAPQAKAAAKKLADETIKSFRDAVKEFDKLAGASPQTVQTIQQTNRVKDATGNQQDIIKLRDELQVNTSIPLPTSIGATDRELKYLQSLKQAAEDLDKSLENITETVNDSVEANEKAKIAFDDRLKSIQESGALELLNLQESIDLTGVVSNSERDRIKNHYDIQRLREQMSADGYGQGQIDEAAEVLRLEQARSFELQRILDIRKQVADASSLGNDLSGKLSEAQNGNREMSEYEKTLLKINTDYRDISDSQKKYLLNTAAQIDAQNAFNDQYKETYDFIRNTFDILTDSGSSFGDKMKSIFGGIADRFKRMLLDMASAWLTNKIVGGSAGGNGSSGGGGIQDIIKNIFGGGGQSSSSSSGGLSNPNVIQNLLGNGANLNGATGSIASLPNGEKAFNVNGSSGGLSGLFGKGGLFGDKGFGANSGTIGGIAAIGQIVGGFIGGRAGNTIRTAATGAQLGLMIGGPIGALIGAAAGGLLGFFGFSDPKRKADKNENLPKLQQGFTDALTQLRELAANKNAILNDPDGVISKAMELKNQIASGFGIQFQSKKYRKIAEGQIAGKLGEADSIISEIKEFAKKAYSAKELEGRIVGEFAGGVYMDSAFAAQYGDFKRRNGMMAGAFTGRDNLPSMIAAGEMVLNPRQINSVIGAAGFDPFQYAGIPNYQTKPKPVKGYAEGNYFGTIAPAVSANTNSSVGGNGQPIYLTVNMYQDEKGNWQQEAESDGGQKVIAKIVAKKYSVGELTLNKQRG